MDPRRRIGWGQSEFYEALCLMMMGVCCWVVGIQLEAFRALDRLVVTYGLSDLLMLGFLLGLGGFAASLRKSLQLRRTMRERDAAEGEATAAARHDPLTGLANRRHFVEAVEACRSRAEAADAAVLLIDLDRFKPINDLHGHTAGDAVLCAVADRLSRLLPPGGMASRLGGDEFALLVEEDGGRESFARLAQSLVAAISEPILWEGQALSVGATVGIALASGERGAEAVMHAADLAMIQAKREGLPYRVFEDAMDAALKARAKLECDLRRALERSEIEPFYQPVVALPGQGLIGFEVLARWRHPERGLMQPAAFIPVAEETGLIAEMSYQLLRKACRDAAHWPSHLQLAVNISPVQFQDPLLARKILAILTESGFPAERLEIEITETVLMNDLDATRATLASLQALGVRIALDDFGTGYSSLYHLRELKFDKLKIDRSYVSSIDMGDERAKLVDAIIKLGNSLGLATTAEGIENDTSVAWLSNQGCDFGQGYLFGRPMSKPDTDRYVAAEGIPALPGGGTEPPLALLPPPGPRKPDPALVARINAQTLAVKRAVQAA
ncbi:bifunctional diguanylate cyclase/phosphodiesterase [Methylobacterium organophilum]|uniref:putative bifunctional diguanylate cyclase/phosphodiesterase n=1 Tax=Methylobacterium organophilum TaxID=410 RepID=UPI001F12AB1D|nr:bifunctional diguanylate cyclase/phosphodiesterase [Methylobacterium organophilum]UMY17927.1 bifunctional diguanylate cyclase/phosphodiesterase [Methylobacterium organophilum]